MSIERLDCVLENFVGEPYVGMQADSTGNYVRVEDIVERLSAILSGSHTTLQFRVRVGDLLEELNN